jgi:hypothetical protein
MEQLHTHILSPVVRDGACYINVSYVHQNDEAEYHTCANIARQWGE